MGLALALNQEKLNVNLYNTIYNGSQYMQEFIDALHAFLENNNQFESLLFGEDKKMNPRLLIGFLSLMQIQEEYVFEFLDTESIAYFELLVTTLKWLQSQEHGQADGRVNLYIAALSQLAVEAADRLSKPDNDEESSGSDSAASNDAYVPTLKNRTLKTMHCVPDVNDGPETICRRLKKHYRWFKEKYLKDLLLHGDFKVGDADNRKAAIICELKGLQDVSFQKAQDLYGRVAEKFGIVVNPHLPNVIKGEHDWIHGLAFALVDLIHPFQDDTIEGQPKINLQHNRKLEDIATQDFSVNVPTSMNTAEMATAAQDGVSEFMLKVFEPHPYLNTPQGNDVCLHLQGNSTDDATYDAKQHFKVLLNCNDDHELVVLWSAQNPVREWRSVTKQRILALECAFYNENKKSFSTTP